MRRQIRTLSASIFAAVAATVSLVAGAAPAAASLGEASYSYAGLVGSRVALGVRATLVAPVAPDVAGGHAAAWVGVGGRGAGPAGEDVWLQVGYAAFHGAAPRLYYEYVRGPLRRYVEVKRDVRPGDPHRMAVARVPRAAGWWRVHVRGRPVTPPLFLPGSEGSWEPVAVAETWSPDRQLRNRFEYRFRRVQYLGVRGSWRPLHSPYVIEDRGLRVRRVLRTGFDAFSVVR